MKKTFVCSLATLGVVGRFYGSGTLATLLTLPLVYAVAQLPLSLYLFFVLIMLVLATKACDAALNYYAKPDPGEIVIDEVVGCLVTFIAIPITLHSLVAGFLLFRFFDISKWLGIKMFSQLRGSWGVVMDDVAAGVISNVVLYLLFVVYKVS